MYKIDRNKYIDDYSIQIDPLFEKIDEMLKVISGSQKVLAECIVPGSKVDAHQAISSLLGILDNRHLVSSMRDMCGIITSDGHERHGDIQVPGSGPIINVVVTDGVVYAARMNSDQTQAIIWKAENGGWVEHQATGI